MGYLPFINKFLPFKPENLPFINISGIAYLLKLPCAVFLNIFFFNK